MRKFDETYCLIPEMVRDGYYPDDLVEKVQQEIQKLVAVLEQGEQCPEVIQQELDRMTLAINDLQEEFEAQDSEIETVARESIAATVSYILHWFHIDIDIDTALGARDW